MTHQLQQRRVIENGEPLAVQQVVDVVVPFTIECGEEINEQAQRQRADQCSHIDLLDFAHLFLQPTRSAEEIDRNEAAKTTQDNVKRDISHRKALRGVDGEHHVLAEEEDGHHRACGGGEQQRQERTAGEVEHQHLESEDQCGNGRLEDGGHGSCGTASQQQRGLPCVELE